MTNCLGLTAEETHFFSNFAMEIVATPGHSDGSISLVIGNKIALVGDCMFGILNNSIFPFLGNNPKDFYTSWKILQGFDSTN